MPVLRYTRDEAGHPRAEVEGADNGTGLRALARLLNEEVRSRADALALLAWTARKPAEAGGRLLYNGNAYHMVLEAGQVSISHVYQRDFPVGRYDLATFSTAMREWGDLLAD
jgi:hypothetical protein